jgi:hypothetical protein
MPHRIERYSDFWPVYLAEHSKPLTRVLHFVGTSLGLYVWAMGIFLHQVWAIPAGLVCGYAFAWVAHFFVQKNKPLTFKYPLWSFVSDFRMWGMMMARRLGPELQRLQQQG